VHGDAVLARFAQVGPWLLRPGNGREGDAAFDGVDGASQGIEVRRVIVEDESPERAMAVVQQAQIRPDKHPLVTKLLGRMSAKQAAIAIANKTARIAWALMVHGGVYEAGHRARQYRAEACAVTG